MKNLISIKSMALVALALGAIASAPAAQASSNVYVTIEVQGPGRYVQPMPTFVQPQPIYRPTPIEYGRFDDHRRHRGHHKQGYSAYRDLDRDGIANRYDRDRDGDGVRNRYDRQPNNPYRR